jgi:hypothetical protein
VTWRGTELAGKSTLIDVTGVYGGRTSRDEILRSLKEAVALVENTASDAELACSGFRVEVMDPGTVDDQPPNSAS